MSLNTNNLPYFKIKPNEQELIIAKFLKRKFLPRIKEKFDKKKTKKKKKSKDFRTNSGKKNKTNWNQLEEIDIRYKLSYVSKQIEQLTSLTNKTNKRLSKIEKELNQSKKYNESSKKRFFFFKR